METKSFPLIESLIAQNEGLDMYIAGGVIRNYFIDPNIKIKDIDLFYLGEIASMIEKLKHQGVIHNGPYGSLRWFPQNEESIYYDIISITEFEHVKNSKTIEDVLEQFDFTANCLAFSLKDGAFFQSNDALADINAKLIRLVRFDYPDEIVSDKVNISRLSVLWFRVLHYSYQLQFNIDPKTKSWINRNSTFFNDRTMFIEYFFKPKIALEFLIEMKLD